MIATVTQTFEIRTEEDMTKYLEVVAAIMERSKEPILQTINIDYTGRPVE